MIEIFKDKKDCCGCTACYAICPQEAISMQPDSEGFLYPLIDVYKCNECGLCKQVCAFQTGYDISENLAEPPVYAVKHLSDEVRSNSTSGGMFTAISDEILKQKGVVYGAGFDENLVVCHQRATDNIGRNKFRGSKYVQSDMRLTLAQVATDLCEGRQALFTGTPCQAGAVRAYLDKRGVIREGLILCDFICHGTPSPAIFYDYIDLGHKTSKGEIVNHLFRSKVNGWDHTEVNIFKNGEVDSRSRYSQLYKGLFHSNLVLRPSCHNCKYTNLNRSSDLTIGDFWGIEKCLPEFDDNKGVSLLLVNTKNGANLLEKVKDSLNVREVGIMDCLQPQLQYPVKASGQRSAFWNDYYSKGFRFVAAKYAGNNVVNRFKDCLRITLEKTGLLEKALNLKRFLTSVMGKK